MGFKAGHIVDIKEMVDPNKGLPSSFSNTQSQFQGSDIEKMYALVLKLQNQYLILENFTK